MQVHTIRKHLLNISNFNGERWAEILAVNLNSPWICVGVAPDIKFLNEILEVGSCLPVE
jgi:hypothetical protein